LLYMKLLHRMAVMGKAGPVVRSLNVLSR